MYCTIQAINLNNNQEIFIESYIKNNGILCTKFDDHQPQGEYQKNKGFGQLGQSINSSSLSEREIDLEGTILGENRLQVETLKKQLISVFNPLDNVLIKYTNEYTIKEIIVKSESVPVFSEELNIDIALAFTVTLDAPYPLWQDQEETIVNVETWESKFEFPFCLESTGVEIGIKGPNEIEFINEGEMKAPLEFYFKAPALNPKIMLNNKEFIQVNRQLNDGDTLYIKTMYGDTRVEIIKSTGERENAYGYIDPFSTFFSLPVGSNIISYSTEGDFIPQSVIVKYKNQYLSL